ncbi:MAG: NfeD family protein [Planctomycetia bacterium]|nr:NfeD family protein [Planctomycetia bacterium]
MDSITQFFNDMPYVSLLIFWASLVLFFMIVEAATAALVSLWFILGGAVAFIAALCGASFWIQVILFTVVSAIAFRLLRPMMIRSFRIKETTTNVDSIVGMNGIVLEEIDNLRTAGRVKVNGMNWSAKSATGENFAPEQIIVVKEVQGVTLIVDKID